MRIAQESLPVIDRSLDRARPYIVNRDYRTVAVIRDSDWEQLGLKEPEISIEEKSAVTGISVEEYKRIAEKAMKAKQDAEEKKLRKAEEAKMKAEGKVPVPKEEPAKESTNYLQPWNCSACTFRNSHVNKVCEAC